LIINWYVQNITFSLIFVTAKSQIVAIIYITNSVTLLKRKYHTDPDLLDSFCTGTTAVQPCAFKLNSVDLLLNVHHFFDQGINSNANNTVYDL